jgi:hypothetical protein
MSDGSLTNEPPATASNIVVHGSPPAWAGRLSIALGNRMYSELPTIPYFPWNDCKKDKRLEVRKPSKMFGLWPPSAIFTARGVAWRRLALRRQGNARNDRTGYIRVEHGDRFPQVMGTDFRRLRGLTVHRLLPFSSCRICA